METCTLINNTLSSGEYQPSLRVNDDVEPHNRQLYVLHKLSTLVLKYTNMYIKSSKNYAHTGDGNKLHTSLKTRKYNTILLRTPLFSWSTMNVTKR